MAKRGQITLFIIVGIVILFTVGFALYMIQKPVFKAMIAKEEMPIETYVKKCIEDVGKEAVIILASQGGYITIPENIKVNPRSYLALTPNGEPKIPYWYYREQNRAPTLESMQKEIGDYVVEHIKACINSFEPFKNQYDITERGNISADVTIGEKLILVKLNYPLDIKDKVKGDLYRKDSFVGQLQANLKPMYEFAKKIMRDENKNMFFENQTIQLMAATPDIPFTGLTFDCYNKIWRKSAIANRIKEMLYWNIPLIRIDGTKNMISYRSNSYEKNHFIWNIDEAKYNDLKVAFRYLPEWGFELHVRPDDSEILKVNSGKANFNFLGLFCINQYHFVYDVNYPLLVMVRDDSAFNGEGLIFNFAFPVIIKNNEGNRKDVPLTEYVTTELTNEFCSETSPDDVDIRALDYYTREEIYRANISYVCITQRCELGQTIPNANTYRLVAKLPSACTGGILIGNAAGYLQGIKPYDGSGYAEIMMKPLRKLNVEFVKHLSNDFSKTRNFTEKENVYLSIKGPEGFERFFAYPEQKNEQLEIIDGDTVYDLEIFLIKNNGLITGGYMGKWDAKYEDFVNKNKVTFNIVEIMPVPVEQNQQIKAAIYLEENQDYKNALKPTFS